LDSVFLQGHEPLQVIVIDDGSTDDTCFVAGLYGEKVKVITQANKGQGAARNAGLKCACGQFVAFLDADDYWKPGFLTACVGFLMEHPDVVAVSTGLVTVMEDGSEVIHPAELCVRGGGMREPYIIDRFFQFWAQYDHVRTGSNVIRRDVIERAGFQRADLRISQDLEYWGYLATFGKWGFIPIPLWVGNSRQGTRTQGRIAKYATRRRLCPEVEQWGARIEPRLRPSDWAGYEIVRGRIALGYAQNTILGGASDRAYHIVRKYGATMPVCTMRRILLLGISLGWPTWKIACGMICLKERAKALRERFRRREQPRV